MQFTSSLLSRKQMLAILVVTLLALGGLFGYRQYSNEIRPKNVVNQVLKENVEIVDYVLAMTPSWSVDRLLDETADAAEQISALTNSLKDIFPDETTIHFLKMYLGHSLHLLKHHYELWQVIQDITDGKTSFLAVPLDEYLQRFDDSWAQAKKYERELLKSYPLEPARGKHIEYFRNMADPIPIDVRNAIKELSF